jgi:hypothetical protein
LKIKERKKVREEKCKCWKCWWRYDRREGVFIFIEKRIYGWNDDEIKDKWKKEL